jgi:hypothetical protein
MLHRRRHPQEAAHRDERAVLRGVPQAVHLLGLDLEGQDVPAQKAHWLQKG